MRRLTACLLPFVLMASLAGGCAHKEQPVVYQPACGMEDLAPGLKAPDNGFALLSDQHTEGRFACGLAIAKLVPRTDEQGGQPVFVQLHPAEEAAWADEFRGVDAIRCLEFLRPLSTRPNGQSTAALCAAAVRLQAPLLLVYVPSRYGPNSAQVVGVLYDAAQQQALATLQSSAQILDEECVETAPDKERGDQRASDACYQAQRTFEAHALACIRELIQRDSTPSTTQPHRWQQPFIERWWQHQR